MRLVEIKRKYIVIDDDGKIVIITTYKNVARRFLDGTDNRERNRSTQDPSYTSLPMPDHTDMESVFMVYDAPRSNNSTERLRIARHSHAECVFCTLAR